MFCYKCGKEIDDEAVICVHCGVATKNNTQSMRTAANAEDSSNFGFAVLGFLIPLVGLILYLMWKDATPLKAKSCGTGALIGFVVTVAGWGCVACIGMADML